MVYVEGCGVEGIGQTVGVRADRFRVRGNGFRVYRGISRIVNSTPLGPCCRTMPRALRCFKEGGAVSYERGTAAGCMVKGVGYRVYGRPLVSGQKGLGFGAMGSGCRAWVKGVGYWVYGRPLAFRGGLVYKARRLVYHSSLVR